MDNEQIAAAIVAMYATMNKDTRWTDTDELIQQAAFGLWAAMTWSAEAMALYLWQHDWTAENAGDFVGIRTARVWAVVREYNSECNAKEAM